MSCIRHSHFVIAGLMVLLAVSAQGQTFRGGIAGTVVDSSAAAVPDAVVKIVHGATGLTRSQVTPQAGDFSFAELPTGVYTLTVVKPGFQTYSAQVEVAVGKIASVAVALGVAQQVETVQVMAAAATLETNEAALNSVVNTRAVQEIPLNGRDFRQLLFLTPGFNQGFSMNGNRGNQNN